MSGARPAGGPHVAPAALLIAALAAFVTAEAAIAWSSTATLETSVAPPPVKFEVGAGGANHRHFKQFTLSENKTAFTAVVKAKAGAYMVVTDVARIVSESASAREVTLSGNQMSNANVQAFTWTVMDGDTRIGSMSSLDPSPSVSFSLAAATSYRLDLRVDLADGAGKDNAAASFDMAMGVT